MAGRGNKYRFISRPVIVITVYICNYYYKWENKGNKLNVYLIYFKANKSDYAFMK